MAPASLFNEEAGLTLSGGFYLESGNKLFQFFPTTFWAFRLPSIVFSNAENESEFLVTFRASVFVTGHLLSLLSLLEWDFPNYLPEFYQNICG
jgi:hypothetical protein